MFSPLQPVRAQAVPFSPGTENCGSDALGLDCAAYTGLKKQDPRAIVGRLIRAALGLLGMIFSILIVYAGFLWMTAAGNEDRVTKAQQILTASVIGLVIILTSYAVTNYVLREIYGAATGDNL